MIAATFGFHGLKVEDLDTFFAGVYISASGLYPSEAGKQDCGFWTIEHGTGK